MNSINGKIYDDLITLHSEEEDGVSVLDEVPTLDSEMSQIQGGPVAWTSEIRGSVCVFDLIADLARIIPEKLFLICETEGKCEEKISSTS